MSKKPQRSWALLLSPTLSFAPGKRSQLSPGPTSSAVFEEEERQGCGHAGPPGSPGGLRRLGPGCARLYEAGRCAWGGFMRGDMHRSLVFAFPCVMGTMFKNEQGWLGTQDPPGGPDHPPRPLTQERKMVHPPSLCSLVNGCCYSLCHPEQMVRIKVVARGHQVSTEPTGLRPSAPVTASHYQRAGCLRCQALTLNSCLKPHHVVLPPQGSSGLSTPGPETPRWDTAVQKPVILSPSSLPTVLPSHASAPGVPGGPATAETVAPLPGAVDEAQGVFKFLLDGRFMDCLVRKVYLCLDKQKAQGYWLISQEPGRPSGLCTNIFHVASFPPAQRTDPKAQLSSRPAIHWVRGSVLDCFLSLDLPQKV